MHLVHGRNVGGENGDDVGGGDVEMGGESGGEAEAAVVGFRPSVDCFVVDDGGTVAVDDCGAFDEGERSERAAVGRVRGYVVWF